MKMKIKLYIVTYKNDTALNNNLDSLFKVANAEQFGVDVFVINNHSEMKLHPALEERVTILHNTLRPDFSTGHLSRNWNQAIINGFVNPNQPDCDLLLTCQDDTIWDERSFSVLFDAMQKYDFVTNGWGDCFCAYTIDAVKAIGLWDERFCNIGYQEADYFLRAVNYHRDKCSINDYRHGRMWQPLKSPIIHRPHGTTLASITSMKYHHVSKNLFQQKWDVEYECWGPKLFDKQHEPKINNYIYYPYFEMLLSGLKEKKFLIP